MANRGFMSSNVPLSYKQCLLAKEQHYECLDESKTENNYICPDTWAAFKRWCPEEVRSRLKFDRKEELFNRDVWLKHA